MTTIIDHPIPDSNTAGLERVVVVTGATGGIGAAITHKLTEEGYTVLAHYGKNHERAHKLKNETQQHGGAIHPHSSDLSTPDGIDHLLTAVRNYLTDDQRRELHGLVNNAGKLLGPSLTDATPAGFDNYFAVNTKAPFFLTQQLTPLMPNGRGSVVNISSAGAHFSSPGDIVYAMSKAALESLTANAAEALAARGIRINTVIPGLTDNGHPAFQDPRLADYLSSLSVLGGVAHPEQVADAIAFLLSDKAARITGAALDVSGGSTLGARPTPTISLHTLASMQT